MPFFLQSFSPHIYYIHTVRDWRLTTSGRARWMRWEMWMQSRFDVELLNVGICSSPLPLTLNFWVQFVESERVDVSTDFFPTFYIVRLIPDIFVWFEFPYSIFFPSFFLSFFLWSEEYESSLMMSERDERVRQLKIVGIFFLIVRWFRIHKLQFS